jgi:hypothetical protein
MVTGLGPKSQVNTSAILAAAAWAPASRTWTGMAYVSAHFTCCSFLLAAMMDAFDVMSGTEAMMVHVLGGEVLVGRAAFSVVGVTKFREKVFSH